MKTILIMDKALSMPLSQDLKTRLLEIMKGAGYSMETLELGKNEASPCLGCLLCITKHPTVCVTHDLVDSIKQHVREYGLTVYLTPVLFGHFASPVKNAIDRGTGSHNWQVMIGMGEDIDEEEKSTFIDLSLKHRGQADIVHPGMDRQFDAFVSRSMAENIAICDTLKNDLRRYLCPESI